LRILLRISMYAWVAREGSRADWDLAGLLMLEVASADISAEFAPSCQRLCVRKMVRVHTVQPVA
jgi:hypothetical protein